MNKERRKRLAEIAEQIENLKNEIESIRDDEQSAFENLPESIQNGERGQIMETAISEMESAMDSIDDIINNLSEAQQ